MLNSGLVLIIDYGYPASEYYLDERSSGTLICHYQHHAHADPLWYPGLQDITAFVDFSAVADAAVKGDRRLALQALLLDEMAIVPDKTEEMLDELLRESKDLLPRFFG